MMIIHAKISAVLWLILPQIWVAQRALAWIPSSSSPRKSATLTLSNAAVSPQEATSFRNVVQTWATAKEEDSSTSGSTSSSTLTSVESSSNTSQPVNHQAQNVPHPPSGKVERAIQEMERKDRSGANLTQAYCDSVLGLCVAYDEWESVLEVLDIMKRQGWTQERSSYSACLQACFETGNGASAQEILQAMEKATVDPTPSDIGLTVAAMCRNNHHNHNRHKNNHDNNTHTSTTTTNQPSAAAPTRWWRNALGLIQSTATNTKTAGGGGNTLIPVQAYDAVLECMVEERQWKEAVRLLRAMEEGSSPQHTKGQPIPSGGLHPAPEISTYREVIECCVTTNQAEQAVQVLYSMKKRGVKPSTYSFELVISALSKKCHWRRAVQLLELMEELEVPKTVVTYNTVISACARSREVGMAKNLLSKMRKQGIRPNEVSFNSVIGACASTARWRDALTLLDQCYREPGVTPNIYIYTNAMRACAKGGKTERALSLLQIVKDKGLPLDTYFYTAAIDACAKARMWKRGLALLDEMQRNGIEPSEVTYSVAISACGNGGQWRKALDLLSLMREKGMTVNLITYNAGITALSKSSRQNARSARYNNNREDLPADGELWSRALILLGQMKEDGIEPDGFSYSSAISCCGAEGRWEEALELIDIMKRGGPRTRPNKIAYTAAISACGQAGEAKRALGLFQTMKDEGLSADRIAYNALFSALRVAGYADKTYELWGEICGTRSTSTRAIATAKDIATPDIITVTDCISTLATAERMSEVDQVFREAVQRGIVLRGNQLDSQWETDLSGMSFPVARAACRYILRQCLQEDSQNLQDVTFITGVGRAQQKPKGFHMSKQDVPSQKDVKISLREYVQEVLRNDFQPSVESFVPERAQGTVQANKRSLVQWMNTQEAE